MLFSATRSRQTIGVVFSGVRGSMTTAPTRPEEVNRDYELALDENWVRRPADDLCGKITTSQLAEAAMIPTGGFLQDAAGVDRGGLPCRGGEFAPDGSNPLVAEMIGKIPFCRAVCRRRLVRPMAGAPKRNLGRRANMDEPLGLVSPATWTGRRAANIFLDSDA